MSKLRVITPFWDTRRWDRYRRQFEEIASQVELHIVHTTGPVPESKAIQFHDTGTDGRSRYRRLFREAILATQIQPDLIYSLSALSLQSSTLVMSLQEKIPYLIRVRGDGRKERYRRYSWLNRVRHNVIDRETLARASRLVPISQRLKARMEGWDLDKRTQIMEPVPNGINLELFPEKPVASEFIVGYAGWLTDHKNSEYLLQLMKLTPDIHYKICGWVDPLWEYRIPENCEHLGTIPFKEMGPYYEEISLLVNPSKTEGFPKTLLEAYSVGRPVLINQKAISSDIPIIGQAIPLKMGSWIDSIYHFKQLHETGGLDRLRHVARGTANEYGWDRFREKMVDHMREVLN